MLLAAASAAQAQFSELQPSAYGVWAPQVGSGAVYQIETQGKTQVQKHAVVGTQDTAYGTGHWLETHITTIGDPLVTVSKGLFVPQRDKLLPYRMTTQLRAGTSGVVALEYSVPRETGETRWDWRAARAIDFRSMAKRIGTQSLSTPAGVYDCELWLMKKGGTQVCYSPQVIPFGVVKISSKAGSVLLTAIIYNAREVMVAKKKNMIGDPAAESAALYNTFPGVWRPVVGSGAGYQLQRNGIEYDLELAVTDLEKWNSETVYSLEVHAPCTGRGLAHGSWTPPQYPPFRPTDDDTSYSPGIYPGRWDTVYPNDPHKGSCTNRILLNDTNLAAFIEMGVFKTSGEDPVRGSFNVLDTIQAEASAAASDRQPGIVPADFRKRAVMLGKETIATPAGTFLCEHWRSHDGKTDVWLNAEVTPFGLVKKTDAAGDLLLTKLITKAKSRTKGARPGDSSRLRVELRPRQ